MVVAAVTAAAAGGLTALMFRGASADSPAQDYVLAA